MADGRKYRVGFDPGIVTSPSVHAFHDYWQSLRGTRRFPAKAEIDVTAIPRLAPGLILLKVFRDPLDFEYRIIGDDLVSRFGDVKGRRVRETVLVNVTSSAYANYCAVVEAGRPQFLQGLAASALFEDPRMVSRVHCPLSSDGETVDHIISYVTFVY
jgi:PAS domain